MYNVAKDSKSHHFCEDSHMIDPVREHLLTLNEAAAECPRPVHCSTAWRWALRGIGHQRLETTKIAGRRYTSREALLRFFETSCTTTDSASAKTVVSPSRMRSINAARDELVEAGVIADPGNSSGPLSRS
jgi:Protein of unknown function (DUF1580)